ncbi:assimilatory sulfite reductase (NADPH) flavoprotein subunit [Solilutibacter tolerans]|uniref:assimilatory sulfite reductase (NADPH) n=1 Tax=Solilutibacter tolerans TaxID=1604334 RepID=A0A1N6RST5_9GAMM|nr:assimilatory sulfite reductase (NADPH) flavoprotein subunit [Lysobacter tolerans]SIQ31849.1 sulfite reductase (NADPH) alpha subunit [Lysobacter tolerans]
MSAAFPLSTTAGPSTLPDALLQQLQGLDGHALWWLSGYTAGLAHRGGAGDVASLPAPALANTAQNPRISIVFGSQTGNAQRVAENMDQRLREVGLSTRLLRADAYPQRELKDESYLIIVISTQGEGDPPDDARGFVEYLQGPRAPKLPNLRYAILGLGDSSYPLYCEVGKQVDARLGELGGQRWLPRADADVDIDSIATPWLQEVTARARELLAESPTRTATVTPLHPRTTVAAHDKQNPFVAEILQNQRISGRDSERDIRHIELSLEGSGLHYTAGDALGVWPRNPWSLVEAIIDMLGVEASDEIEHSGKRHPLGVWLRDHRELTRLTRPFLVAHAERASSEELDALLAAAPAQLSDLFATHQVIDVLQRWPATWTANDFIAVLRVLTPRIYSIASSQDAVGDEAHITVSHLAYQHQGEDRWGAASHDLAGLAVGERARVFIEHNPRFSLPADTSRDILMIGPGVGVAPFRGFLQSRIAGGGVGRNWLFFGNRHAHSEFLYQSEWQPLIKAGQLKLDLAFSRDMIRGIDGQHQPAGPKYVQDCLLARGEEVHAWLEGGAHLYVCGDATHMARDVHAALTLIMQRHGGLDAEAAQAQLDALQTQGRYARDVY